MDPKSPIGTTSYFADDRVDLIANFIAQHICIPNIEIEAKLGFYKFRDKSQSQQHIALIPPESATFTSEVKKVIFDSLKETLICKGLSRWSQEETEDTMYSGAGMNSKLRSTYRLNGEFVENIKKTKIKDLNFVVNSLTGLGFRISANIEEKLSEIPDSSRPVFHRVKTRNSFSFQYLSYDLTDVDSSGVHSYEIELELKDTQFIRKYAEGYTQGVDRDSLVAIANKFWHNILCVAYMKPKIVVQPVQEDLHFRGTRLEQYSRLWGAPKPLIGDYLFEVAKETQEEELVTL